jgi:hypothetical protein
MNDASPRYPLRIVKLLVSAAVVAVTAGPSALPAGDLLAQAVRPEPPVRGSSAEVRAGTTGDRTDTFVQRDRAAKQAAERRRRETELEERRERARKQRAAQGSGND